MSSSTDPPAGRDLAPDRPSLASIHDRLTSFVEAFVDESGADGVVVTLDGGADSAVAATLAVDALGPDRVYGLVLPCTLGTEADALDARAVAASLGIESSRIHLQPLLSTFLDRAVARGDAHGESVAVGNVIARVRMAAAYFVANATSRLVLGTGNRTERLLGSFTKHGDCVADLLPIGDLYRTEVRALARFLGVPEFVVAKPSTVGPRVGRTGGREHGASDETIDAVLHRLVDRDEGIDGVASDLGVDSGLVERLARRHADARHKRGRPPTPSQWGDRAESRYFYELELRFD